MLWNRIKGLYPVWLAAFLVFYIIHIVQGHVLPTAWPDTLFRSFPAVFLLSNLGLPTLVGIPYSWYIPTMLMAMSLLLPPLCHGRRRFTLCYAPLIALLGYCWLWRTYGTILALDEDWCVIIFPKTVRALADMCLGLLSYEACGWMQQRWGGKLNALGRRLATLAGVGCLVLPLGWMTFSMPREKQLPAVALFALGIAVLFSGLGHDLPPAWRGVGIWLGRYSYALYLGQGVPKILLAPLYGQVRQRFFVAAYLALALAAGLAIHLLGKALRAGWRHEAGWLARRLTRPAS